MSELIRMWKYPRMVAWFIITFTGVLLARIPFGPAQIIPYYLDFNPGIVLAPLTGILWGSAGAWGCLAAFLVGDRLMGMWSTLSLFRAAGVFLFALTAQRLWTGKSRPDWKSTACFLIIAVPGCCVAGTWLGIGSEFIRLYPFSYVAGITVVHHLIFTVLLGVALYRIATREFVPRWGTWRDVMHARKEALSVKSVIFIWVGGLGGFAAGCLAGAFFYRIAPLRPFVLGTTCGIGLRLIVIPFILIHIAGLIHISQRAGSGRADATTV